MVFTIYKDNNQQDKWKNHTIAKVQIQDIMNIFNLDYVPTTIADSELFGLEQQYIYTVFTNNVQIDFRRTAVQEHQDDYNAQVVYKISTSMHLNPQKVQ